MKKLRRFGTWFHGDGAFFRYLLTGVSISLIDLTLFAFFTVMLGWHEVLANVASTIISICVSYLANRVFVFRATRMTWSSFFSFAGVTLVTGVFVQSFVIWGLVALSARLFPELEQAIVLSGAKIFAMGIGAIANYLGYRWVFRKLGR